MDEDEKAALAQDIRNALRMIIDPEIGQTALRHSHGEIVMKKNHDGLTDDCSQEEQGDGLQSR